MNRMFLVPSVLLLGLGAASTAFAADAPSGKSLYSSRPDGGQSQAPRMVLSDEPSYAAPPMLVGQPVIQSSPFVVQTQGVPTLAPVQPQDSGRPTLAPPKPQYPRIDGPVFSQPMPSGTVIYDGDMNRPLSGIDVPSKSPLKKQETPKTTTWVQDTSVAAPAPVDAKGEQIDGFYARLAKLQLEKKNLPESLTLIGKIKNAAFKVQTLVELAEYVAHDDNYKKEAETLFGLAQTGIESLAAGKPVAVETKDEEKDRLKELLQPKKTETPEKKPTLLDDLQPAKPVIEEKKPEAAPKKPSPILLDEEPAAEEKKPEASKKKPSPILLDEEPVVEKKKSAPLIDEDIQPSTKPLDLESAPKESDESAKKSTRRPMPTGKKINLEDE